MEYRLSKHVLEELPGRRISLAVLHSVVTAPQQIVPVREGKMAYQSIFEMETGKLYLVRAIVNDGVSPAVVVTAYRTSKIEKYWRDR